MIRPYEDADRREFWGLKRAFETGMGATGDDAKQTAYEAKLDDAYRTEYFDWLDRCRRENERCVTVAERDGTLVGYVFVLPESHAYIWDGAVLNELFVEQSHRGSDLADALMDEAIAVARSQSLPMDRLVLDVDRSNERARAFYDRWGFDHWGEMVARPL